MTKPNPEIETYQPRQYEDGVEVPYNAPEKPWGHGYTTAQAPKGMRGWKPEKAPLAGHVKTGRVKVLFKSSVVIELAILHALAQSDELPDTSDRKRRERKRLLDMYEHLATTRTFAGRIRPETDRSFGVYLLDLGFTMYDALRNLSDDVVDKLGPATFDQVSKTTQECKITLDQVTAMRDGIIQVMADREASLAYSKQRKEALKNAH